MRIRILVVALLALVLAPVVATAQAQQQQLWSAAVLTANGAAYGFASQKTSFAEAHRVAMRLCMEARHDKSPCNAVYGPTNKGLAVTTCWRVGSLDVSYGIVVEEAPDRYEAGMAAVQKAAKANACNGTLRLNF